MAGACHGKKAECGTLEGPTFCRDTLCHAAISPVTHHLYAVKGWLKSKDFQQVCTGNRHFVALRPAELALHGHCWAIRQEEGMSTKDLAS